MPCCALWVAISSHPLATTLVISNSAYTIAVIYSTLTFGANLQLRLVEVNNIVKLSLPVQQRLSSPIFTCSSVRNISTLSPLYDVLDHQIHQIFFLLMSSLTVSSFKTF